MPSLVRSFPPVARGDAQLLILGSMPGERSLAEGRYYAHPQNAFWKILGATCGFDPGEPYAARLRALRARHIALWDVLGSCERPGSLDAAIRPDSASVNDFRAFFARHRGIETVLFNGATAERYFERFVLLDLERAPSRRLRMPSTSPAHAGLSFGDKLTAWRRGLATTLDLPPR